MALKLRSSIHEKAVALVDRVASDYDLPGNFFDVSTPLGAVMHVLFPDPALPKWEDFQWLEDQQWYDAAAAARIAGVPIGAMFIARVRQVGDYLRNLTWQEVQALVPVDAEGSQGGASVADTVVPEPVLPRDSDGPTESDAAEDPARRPFMDPQAILRPVQTSLQEATRASVLGLPPGGSCDSPTRSRPLAILDSPPKINRPHYPTDQALLRLTMCGDTEVPPQVKKIKAAHILDPMLEFEVEPLEPLMMQKMLDMYIDVNGEQARAGRHANS